jgi:hypothetical protein
MHGNMSLTAKCLHPVLAVIAPFTACVHRLRGDRVCHRLRFVAQLAHSPPQPLKQVALGVLTLDLKLLADRAPGRQIGRQQVLGITGPQLVENGIGQFAFAV